ncbi:hypothetical protein CAI21_08605 [Alkalilimnicola ehrlichii]|uniref:metallophosphoesterase n=1 Tax=Alkalilimnicola ehrlichii TaxID=351052 RepID=UPI000E2FCAC1|nr:metallophosphoesterase [Alkalilimnicola ehrlichii]RFA29884.1 hypothetical protein CAI21_08605 [Alkalilimnicola ehrlichii]
MKRLAYSAALLAFLLALQGCGSESDNNDSADNNPPQEETQPTLRFIAVGDTGTGGERQYRVADAMQQVCLERGCDFALGLGDNIYEVGAGSPYDPQFEEKFELPYRNLDFTFYMTLGNHDNSLLTGLGLYNDQGQNQVAYHYRADRSSEKWYMPYRYYSVEHEHALFMSLDSNPLVTPGDNHPNRGPITGYKETQTRWFLSTVERSPATWRFAFAHYPYISNGRHGNAGRYDLIPGLGIRYKRFLEKRFASMSTYSSPATITTCNGCRPWKTAPTPSSSSAAPARNKGR